MYICACVHTHSKATVAHKCARPGWGSSRAWFLPSQGCREAHLPRSVGNNAGPPSPSPSPLPSPSPPVCVCVFQRESERTRTRQRGRGGRGVKREREGERARSVCVCVCVCVYHVNPSAFPHKLHASVPERNFTEFLHRVRLARRHHKVLVLF